MVAACRLPCKVSGCKRLLHPRFVRTGLSDSSCVLVLSELAGAAQELDDAAIINNPYDVEVFADGLELAVDMPFDERNRRMRALRRAVAGRDVLQWASNTLEGLEQIDPRSLRSTPGRIHRVMQRATLVTSVPDTPGER